MDTTDHFTESFRGHSSDGHGNYVVRELVSEALFPLTPKQVLPSFKVLPSSLRMERMELSIIYEVLYRVLKILQALLKDDKSIHVLARDPQASSF